MLTLAINHQQPRIECNISLDASGFYILYGISGVGKSTLLNCIAGLTKQAANRVVLNGEALHNKPTHLRNIAFVQQYRDLFPHLSVAENLQFAVKYIDHRADQWIELDEIIQKAAIRPLLNQFISQLSGGEKQRVSLAQMLIRKPRLLLLDEPFSALDRTAKQALMEWLKQLNSIWQIPMIFVTHDHYEIEFLKVPVLSMKNGVVSVQ